MAPRSSYRPGASKRRPHVDKVSQEIYTCPDPNCDHSHYNPACDEEMHPEERIRHIPTVNGVYTCPICQHTHRPRADMKTHLYKHFTNKFTCSGCGKGYTRADSLKRHHNNSKACDVRAIKSQ
jgi:transposase-like protein